MKKKTAVRDTATQRPRAVPQVGVEEGQAARREATVRKIFDSLSPFEASAPPGWVGCTTPDRIFPGRCFDRSFHFALDVSLTFPPKDPAGREVWLVHGEFWIGQRHAWVELPGGVVFDGTNQRFYDRSGYYKAVGARPWYMYSPSAALMISNHMPENADGTIRLANWHGDLALPWADPNNPTRIDYPEVLALLKKSGLKPRPVRGRKKARTAT